MSSESLLNDITLDGKKVTADDLVELDCPVHFRMVDGALVVERLEEPKQETFGPLPD